MEKLMKIGTYYILEYGCDMWDSGTVIDAVILDQEMTEHDVCKMLHEKHGWSKDVFTGFIGFVDSNDPRYCNIKSDLRKKINSLETELDKITKPIKIGEMKMKYNQRHGGAFDRGAADSYYRRGCHPHYYVGGTSMSELVEQKDMTTEEIEAYRAGFAWNEELGDFKDWR